MSSFSLPSASGVVSLLNDAEQTKIGDAAKGGMKGELRPSLNGRTSSSTSSAHSPVNGSTYGSSSSDSADNGSLTSTLTSMHDSSIESLESAKLSDIHSLRKQLKAQGMEVGEARRNRHGDSPQDDERTSEKRKISHELHGRRPSHLRTDSNHSDKILDQPRLAASPKPMNASVENVDSKDVPSNMHKATSMSDNDASLQSDSKVENSTATSLSSSTSGKRRYPCSHPGCDKTFSTSGHAARHNRIHTGTKPYRCTFPGCNASFSRQDNSLQHYRTHVLHPKSRSNGGATMIERGSSLETNGNNLSPSDGPLQGLDAETEATVRMGRKALQEGTAIAVVHEVVDGNGRRGEAVQRMVGQPKGSRRGSSSTSRSDVREREASHRIQGDEVDDDEDSISVGGGSWTHHSPANHTYPYHQSTPVHGESQGYAPPLHSHHQAIAYPPAASPPLRNGSYMTSAGYRPNAYNPASSTYFHSQDYPYSKSLVSNYDMVRRGSGHNYLQQHSDSNRAATVAAHHFYTATQFPQELLRRPNTMSSFDHKRAQSFGGSQQLRPSFHLESDRQRAREGIDSYKTVSSSSPSTPQQNKMGGNDKVLSLLPVSSSSASLPSLSNSSPGSHSGLRSRNGGEDLHLPSITKLPYSSDRSTTVQATTPLEDAKSHQRIKSSDYGRTSSTFESGYRTLPPLRGALRR